MHSTAHNMKFWVVGGRFRDTAFNEVEPGTETVIGPLPDRNRAMEIWRRMSEQARSDCLMRFSIACE